MANQMTAETLQIRFALPLELLQNALRECDAPWGSPADLAPFAERLETSASLADWLAAILRTVKEDDGVPLTRMDMLDLLCLAVSGTDVQSSGPASRNSLRQMLVFVNGVLLSMRTPTAQAKQGEQIQEQEPVRVEASVVDFDLPENFYVLESFALASPQVSAPATAALTAPSGEAPAARMKAAEPDRAIVDEVSTTDLSFWTPKADPAQDFAAPTPLAFSAASGTDEPTVGSAFIDEVPAARSSWKVREDRDVDELAQAAPAKRGFLSQSALLACAFVVGFVGGMLVPRSAPGKGNVLASSERAAVESDLAHAQYAPKSPGPVRLAGLPVALPVTGVPLAAFAEGPAHKPSSEDGLPQRTVQASAQGMATLGGGSIIPHADMPSVQSPSVPAAGRLPFGSEMSASVSQSVALAHLVRSPKPEYPVLAKLTNVEGEVVMAVVVSAHGDVIASRVLQGPPLLRGAAEMAVRHWQFQPFLENGNPCQIQTSVVVEVRPPL